VALFLMDAPWQLLVATCIASAGVGIGYAAMPTLILDTVPMREAAAAVGLNALMRSMGTTLAAAVMTTVLTSRTLPLGGFEFPTRARSSSASSSGRPQHSSASPWRRPSGGPRRSTPTSPRRRRSWRPTPTDPRGRIRRTTVSDSRENLSVPSAIMEA
jgi:hypothetical protein